MATFAKQIEEKSASGDIMQSPEIIAYMQSPKFKKDMEASNYLNYTRKASNYKIIVKHGVRRRYNTAAYDDVCVKLFMVAQAECPDIEYFETLNDAKNYVDKYRDSHQLDYGYIMRVVYNGCIDKEEEVGYWGEFYEDWEHDDDDD